MKEIIGHVQQWNDQKGYGFIKTPDGQEVFFHISAMRGDTRPQEGDKVFFQLSRDKQGRPSAQHVRHTQLTLDNSNIRVKPKPYIVDTDKRMKKQVRKGIYKLGNFPFRLLFIMLLVPALGLLKAWQTEYGLWLLLSGTVFSVLAFIFYWRDKRRALGSEWRIPEANLHFLSFLGGVAWCPRCTTGVSS